MTSATPTESSLSRPEPPRKWRLRVLLWAAIVSFLIGFTDFGEPLEDLLLDLRNVSRGHAASGEVVIVGIDNRSLKELDKWPWPRRHYAALIEKMSEAGAAQIFVDVDFSSPSDPAEDEIMQRALARSDAPVILPVHTVFESSSNKHADLLPIEPFKREAGLASINTEYNFRGELRYLPYRSTIGGVTYPSFATKLAGVEGPEGERFPIDFAIDPRSIPTVSAVDVIEGRADPALFAGKSVILGSTSLQLGDVYLMPGHGMLSGIYFQALGAETLSAEIPVSWGWLPSALLAVLLAAGLALPKDVRIGAAGAAVAIAAFFGAAIFLEQHHIYLEIVPAVILLLIVGCSLAWSSVKHFQRSRGNINSVSGLPNLNVLRQETSGQALTLIVAKVHNYAEIASALPSDGETRLVQQIARRLTLMSATSKLYHSDEGIFAWFTDMEGAASPGEHLNALYGIFRSPMTVIDSQVDVTLTFGVDARKDKPLASRLGSALVAADEALREGLKWKDYDPSQQQDLTWKLSLLSQLDRAIDQGDLWIAFQPKLDLATRKIVGAEALARWDHPEKGEISPLDFILAAEQSGRIGKLTDYVLDRSIEAAAKLNRQALSFNVAVNLSARLIDGVMLTATISRLLAEHRLPPECLTLEITETAALAGAGRDCDILKELREMGVKLSIDDYGTGLSTLDYMKRIPATEIKIDKSFIQAMENSRSDRLMVHSTIQLAHSLGQKVVAEGVERAETLDALAEMGCDIVQGYLIGRPLPIKALERRLLEQRRAA